MDVFDPVLGNGCVTGTQKNITWHPIRTATNAALCLGIIQWIMDNQAYNAEYLSFPTFEAAVAGGYASNTNATHLVIVDESHPNYRKIMTAEDAGLEVPEPETDENGEPIAATYYVVIDAATGEPALHSACSQGTLEYEGEVNGVKVRTAFMLLKDGVYEHTIEEYSEITGVPVETIENVAREFTSHGVKAGALVLGAQAAANGLSTNAACGVLTAMIGCDQMVGGLMSRRNGAVTTADGERYKLATFENPGVSAAYISRTNVSWEDTDEYKNRVAAGEEDPKPMLPWINVGSASDNQALASIINQYPYQCKILISWMTDTLQSSSGFMRDAVIERLCDPEVLPLHIACDVVIGEHASLADYIVPDTTPHESWGIVTQEGHWKGRGNAVRWPVKKPETIELGDGRNASYEAFLCDVAKACGLPGFGDDAIEATDGTLYPLNDAYDYFLKGVANLAWDTEPVEDIDESEIKIQALDELPEAWKSAVTEEEWPKVLRVLSRGGRYWDVALANGEDGRATYMKENTFYLYGEKKALAKNDYSGEHFAGALRYEEELLADGTPLYEKFPVEEWPFKSTNYKPRFRSISMLANSPIMRDLCASNYLEINLEDAEELGINDGDTIRITNPTGDVMEGPAMVRGGIAKGTFGVAYGYGHVGYGAQPIHVEGGYDSPGDPAIGAGIHLQTILDPTIDALYPFADPEASAPARNGGAYKIEKA